jgi:hypothetical protein
MCVKAERCWCLFPLHPTPYSFFRIFLLLLDHCNFYITRVIITAKIWRDDTAVRLRGAQGPGRVREGRRRRRPLRASPHRALRLRRVELRVSTSSLAFFLRGARHQDKAEMTSLWMISDAACRGFPLWLHFIPGIKFRTDNEPFKAEMQRFTTKVVHSGHHERGGTVRVAGRAHHPVSDRERVRQHRRRVRRRREGVHDLVRRHGRLP